MPVQTWYKLKVHQLLRNNIPNASLYPRDKHKTSITTGNIFTFQSTGLGGKTVSTFTVEPHRKYLLPTSDGESPGHWWMETVAEAYC